MIQREFGAVLEFAVAFFVPDVTGVMKQRRDDHHLCPIRAKALGGVHATFVTGHEARQRQRHVERVLHVVVSGITAQVARIFAVEQALEIVEGEPELVERGAREGVGEQFAHGIAYRHGIAYLHGIGDIEVVTPVLGQYSSRFFARGHCTRTTVAGFLVSIHAWTVN